MEIKTLEQYILAELHNKEVQLEYIQLENELLKEEIEKCYIEINRLSKLLELYK